MNTEKQINEFIDMLDNFVSQGGGHINVTEKYSDDDTMTVQTFRSADCGINMACCQPTAHIGIDDADNN